MAAEEGLVLVTRDEDFHRFSTLPESSIPARRTAACN